METIWMIGVVSYDDQYPAAEDAEGFFTTKDKAQAKADEYNKAAVDRHAKHVEDIDSRFKAETNLYKAKLAEREVIEAAGLTPSEPVPVEPRKPYRPTYIDYMRSYDGSWWEVIQVDKAK